MSAIVKLADNSSVYEVAKVSPLSIAIQLSKKFDNQVYLKREDDQIIHSFKLRGAYQKMSSMNDEQKAKGVIASSAGNHAQGVALGASKLGISSSKVRVGFIYSSFIALGSPLLIYLIMAWILEHKHYFKLQRKKRNTIWEL